MGYGCAQFDAMPKKPVWPREVCMSLRAARNGHRRLSLVVLPLVVGINFGLAPIRAQGDDWADFGISLAAHEDPSHWKALHHRSRHGHG